MKQYADVSTSEYSVTPRSGLPYELKESKTPILGNRHDQEHVHIKDMIVSGYDQRANVSLWKIFLAAAIGLGAGLVLTKYEVSSDWAKWISLPGDLFVSALKCLIVPMVFCSVVVCIGELVEAGKAVKIGSRTILYFAMASIMSSTLGTFFGWLFKDTFKAQRRIDTADVTMRLALKCFDGTYLSMAANGSMACSAADAMDPSALLILNDTTGFFTSAKSRYQQLSVSEQIFAVLSNLVPENIVASFAGSSTLSVITFAIWFGIASVKSYDKAEQSENYILLLVAHTNAIARMMINTVVSFIPFAIVSMVAGSLAEFSSSTDLLEGVAFLIVSLITALLTNTIGVMGLALFLTTRCNIFAWLKNIVPAQIFILGCASSIATLPLTMRCVDASREVSHALSRFVLPLGATSNLNGTAVYMPLACIFMAQISGYEDMLTPVRYVLLGFVGAISSFGVAAVPHSGLVMVITVWRTVFGMDVPPVFTLLVGTDWILDRLRSVVNITNDTIIVRIIASQCDEATLRQLENTPEGEFRGPATPSPVKVY